ncbi:putative dna repair protein rad26 [Erysiphe necator]|uniref:Putative dna repair protein rad26 n=1 Tax=Uncinula necator TaxID=52586 RepID=A0A0B1P127_UNCNE|nr:putative dna repair protein rad26 [Erysiphe necator]
MVDFQDEDYSDDDLDKLPQDTYIELENKAIQYTQAQTQAQARLNATSTSDYGDDLEDDDLKYAVVIGEPNSTHVIIQSLHKSQTKIADLDDNIGEKISQRREPSLSLRTSKSGYLSSKSQLLASQDNSLSQENINHPLPTHSHVKNLQKQVEELIRERDSLKLDLFSKAGEIAIVRNKQEKIVKDYEQQLHQIQKLNAEKLEQQQKELEIARESEKKATIDRDFIKRDLAEESERVRRLNREKEREREANIVSLSTPKRRKNIPHRDGFDDPEIKSLTSSKNSSSSSRKGYNCSPPVKQKYKAIQSPLYSLDIIPVEESIEKDVIHNSAVSYDKTQSGILTHNDFLIFIGAILNHRIDEEHLFSIQEFGKYALPSAPHDTLQTLILAKISELSGKKSLIDVSVSFCETLLTIWLNCVEEEYLKPINLLIDLITLVLELKTTSLVPHIVDKLLPIAQRTADFIAIPRFQSRPTDKYDKEINLSACISLLYLVSLGCMNDSQYITRFWRLMRWDFVLVMLSTNQLKFDYDLALCLISTSALRHSFGALPGGEKQHLQTGWIIDRLTYPLNEHPCKPLSSEKFEIKHLNQVRLSILQLLIRISKSPYTSKALATHPHAIGRLICLINDEIDALYDFYSDNKDSTNIINTAMRLLYHLMIKHISIIDVQQSLAYIHGGSQKYLLSLSRLNFLEEDMILESGIDIEISGYALELLELFVTPEEGDAIQSAFSN